MDAFEIATQLPILGGLAFFTASYGYAALCERL